MSGSGAARQLRKDAALGAQQPSAAPSQPARVFAVYNYKGGVAKTTTILNIASVMAHDMNKSVLLVDCDPQCNLTSFFSPENQHVKDVEPEDDEGADVAEEEDEEGVSGHEAGESLESAGAEGGSAGPNTRPLPCIPSDVEHPTSVGMDVTVIRPSGQNLGGVAGAGNKPSIFDFLHPLFSQYRTSISNDDIKSLKAVTLDGGDEDTEGSRLWLIPGSSDLIKLEKIVGLSETQGEKAQLIRMGFRRLINEITKAKNIEIVFVDFGPSASLLNTIFLSTCDYILPPCFADYFSVASLDGLLFSVLPNILGLREAFMESQNKNIKGLKESFQGDDGKPVTNEFLKQFRFPPNPPKLLFTVSRIA
jgi:cellulose biosynthesis protein BcsQ